MELIFRFSVTLFRKNVVSLVRLLVLLVLLQQLPVRGFEEDYEDLLSKVNIYYMNPHVTSEERFAQTMDEISNFRNTSSVKILIHGYIANRQHVSIAPVTNAYIASGDDSVFIADWSHAARVQYFVSRYFVYRVGMDLAKIIERFLLRNKLDPSHVHLIGHSLGAHISGNIGRYFNGTIGRISGLDPALPLFYQLTSDDLQPNTAKFVDVIHTGAYIYGDFRPRGDVDFYPNYGLSPQPGCNTLDLITLGSCSHYRAVLYFAESILLPENFPAVACPIEQIADRSCQKFIDATHEPVIMGEKLSKDVLGTYYVKTNNVPPYGIGRNGKFDGDSNFL